MSAMPTKAEVNSAQKRPRSQDGDPSHRPFALHRHPRAGAGVRPVVPHRAVLGAAIVPEGDSVFGPAEAALEQRIFRVLVEIVQYRVAFVAGDADDVAGESPIEGEGVLFLRPGGGGPPAAWGGGVPGARGPRDGLWAPVR